jgi:hypothetical protein
VASKELTKPENAQKKNEFLPQHFGHPENPGSLNGIRNCKNVLSNQEAQER